MSSENLKCLAAILAKLSTAAFISLSSDIDILWKALNTREGAAQEPVAWTLRFPNGEEHVVSKVKPEDIEDGAIIVSVNTREDVPRKRCRPCRKRPQVAGEGGSDGG